MIIARELFKLMIVMFIFEQLGVENRSLDQLFFKVFTLKKK